jgi:hypothetical protein
LDDGGHETIKWFTSSIRKQHVLDLIMIAICEMKAATLTALYSSAALPGKTNSIKVERPASDPLNLIPTVP